MNDYHVVGSSKTNEGIGANGGATGDVIEYITVVATGSTVREISIKDGDSGNTLIIYTGVAIGSNAFLSEKSSYTIPMGIRSSNGGWRCTTDIGAVVWFTGGLT